MNVLVVKIADPMTDRTTGTTPMGAGSNISLGKKAREVTTTSANKNARKINKGDRY
jgi:hypothetical protein